MGKVKLGEGKKETNTEVNEMNEGVSGGQVRSEDTLPIAKVKKYLGAGRSSGVYLNPTNLNLKSKSKKKLLGQVECRINHI